MIKFKRFINDCFIIGVFLLQLQNIKAQQQRERPFILVKTNEREKIINKIENESWANSIFKTCIDNLAADISLHNLNPDAYIRKLPFNWEDKAKGNMPPFHLTYHINNGKRKNLDNVTAKEWANAKILITYLNTAVNSAIAYYLTQEKPYAQLALDILNAFVNSVSQSEVSSWRGRGGWLYPDDGFREVREIGEKVPIIYDFLAPFVKNGGKPYDILQKKKINFPQELAQDVFRTYANITINYGHTGSNHPVLEAPSLVYNALAIENPAERNKLLSYFLTKNTEHQDALDVMAKNFKEEGDIWPETSQYLNGVATRLTRLMLIVNRYDNTLKLGKKYTNILHALPALDYMVYPNDEIIRWGDGKRKGKPKYASYEDAYLIGKMDSLKTVTNKFGTLLKRAIESGDYKRNSIESVLLHGVELPDDTDTFTLPNTYNVKHAGIFIQRNLSETNKPQDGLMCFVGGAHMVHGHAEGMNIELYGEGEVLGVDNGRGKYQQDIHENYSRIYAAHNTVIVNGNSQSEGGWVNLGINKVQLIAMEPMPNKQAISPNHSFTQTRFIDDKGNMAEAEQERTIALIRTSKTSGYYIDVFRSKSKLPNEYHDYLYHNIGDKLVFDNKDMDFGKTPDRYMANANKVWKRNKQYRNPGWHFFKDVKTSKTYGKEVKATFHTKKLSDGAVFMQLHIPDFKNRTFTKVKAPITFESPEPYDKKPTPALVIRNEGEAWKNPFVVVYEPFNENENSSIQSVDKIDQDGLYKGLKVTSKTPSETLIQYVITQSKDEVFQNEELDVYFKGTFAIITLDENEILQSIYIGDGKMLKYENEVIELGENNSFYKEY